MGVKQVDFKNIFNNFKSILTFITWKLFFNGEVKNIPLFQMDSSRGQNNIHFLS